jgi:hypothetical protein
VSPSTRKGLAILAAILAIVVLLSLLPALVLGQDGPPPPPPDPAEVMASPQSDLSLVAAVRVEGPERVDLGKLARFRVSGHPKNSVTFWDAHPFDAADVQECGDAFLVSGPPGRYVVVARVLVIQDGRPVITDTFRLPLTIGNVPPGPTPPGPTPPGPDDGSLSPLARQARDLAERTFPAGSNRAVVARDMAQSVYRTLANEVNANAHQNVQGAYSRLLALSSLFVSANPSWGAWRPGESLIAPANPQTPQALRDVVVQIAEGLEAVRP